MSDSTFVDNLKRYWDFYLILIYSFIAPLLFTPGFLYFDSFEHIRMIEEGIDTTWQSPIPAMIWYVFYKAFYFTGPLLLHFLLINFGIFFLVKYFIKNKKLCFALTVMFIVTPIIFGFSVMTLRESLLMGLSLCYLALSLRLTTFSRFLLLTLASIPAALIRYELIPVFILVWGAIYFLKVKDKSRKKEALLGALILIFLFIPKVMQVSLEVKKSHPSAQIFQLDLIQMSALNENFQFEHPNIIKKNIDPNTFKREPGDILAYPTSANVVLDMNFKGDAYSELRSLWLNSIVSHPLTYLENRWVTFKRLLRLPGQEFCMDYVVFLERNNPYGYRWSKEIWFDGALKFLQFHSNRGYYQPYIVLLIAFFLPLIVLFFYKESFQLIFRDWIIFYGFGWCGFLMSFLVTPTCHLRVVILQMTLLMFSILVLVGLVIEEEINKKGLVLWTQALLKKYLFKKS